MLFIGIDVASTKHDIVIVSSEKGLLRSPFSIPNNLDGYEKLRREISSHTESVLDVRIGIEETGIYSKNISDYLALYGYNVHMINPILTSHSRKSLSLRSTKTDKIDALSISRYVEQNFKRLNSYTPSLYNYSELKSLSRARFDILKNQVKAKMEWTRLLDLVFPEFRQAFNQHSKWVYELFSRYPSARQISHMHLSTLQNIVKVHGDRTLAASNIKSMAKATIGNTCDSNAILLINALDDILHYSKQLDRLEKQVKIIMKKQFPFLLTIPGIGPVTGAIIVGEIGDVNRFHSPNALLAYAGLDPTIYQSGNFNASQCHISKHGSKYLRTAIFISTRCAIINPNIKTNKFRNKYMTKVSQGKHHNSAICSASKNMIHVIYAILKSHEVFDFAH